MKLYVNGDSHAAAAEAVNAHVFAEDDSKYFYLGRAPHPENFKVSWARQLASTFKSALYCDAEAASSNQRILRTSRAWLEVNKSQLSEVLVIIQWSTWERQEWQDTDGTYYQVNASGIDDVPTQWQERYKKFIADVNWEDCRNHWHDEIWQFHCELETKKVKHVFFNGNTSFKGILNQHIWGNSYIDPYSESQTYDQILKNNGIDTVGPASWHFGKDGHSFWHKFMLQYVIANQLI